LHTTKPQHANKVKNYGQTIQQSRKSKTPEPLRQTQKNSGQGQKSRRDRRRAKSGLTGHFETIEKAARSGGLFDLWRRSVSVASAVTDRRYNLGDYPNIKAPSGATSSQNLSSGYVAPDGAKNILIFVSTNMSCLRRCELRRKFRDFPVERDFPEKSHGELVHRRGF
jgi:hypothetical protein